MPTSKSSGFQCSNIGWQLTTSAVFCIALAVTSAPVVGQMPQINNASDLTHAPVSGAGHDYQHLLNETVNFSNGSINLKLSFPMPKGRGLGLPLSWTYSSASVNPLDILDGNTPYWDNPSQHGGANPDGWYTFEGIPTATAQVWSVNGNGYNPISGVVESNDTWIPCNFQSGMTFRDSDGVSHDLNIWAEAAASNANSSGYIDTCNDSTSFTPITSPPGGDGQVIATLTPDTASAFLASSSPQSGAFIVIDEAGTTYQFGGGVTTSAPGAFLMAGIIEDRNGNRITATGDQNAPYKDTAGRELYRIISDSASQSKYTIGGTGDYVANWGQESVSFPIQATGGSGSGSNVECQPFPTTVTATHLILNSLVLPNLQSFRFFYGNSNPYDQTILNPYGLINEIIYPDGGWVKYIWTLPASGVFNALSEAGGRIALGPVGNNQMAYQQQSFGCFYQYQVPVLSKRIVSFDGTNPAETQTITYGTSWDGANGLTTSWLSRTTTVQTTDNVVGRTAKTAYTYLPAYAATQKFAPGSIVPQIPMESTISYYDWGKSTPSKVITKTWLDQFRMTSESTQILPTNQVSERVFTYGAAPCSATSTMTSGFSYPLEEDDWDFGVLSSSQPPTAPGTAITPPSSTPTKRTIYQYQCFSPNSTGTYSSFSTGAAPFPGVTLPPQVSSVTIEAGNSIQAVTKYTYDNPQTPASFTAGIDPQPIQFDPKYALSATPRGNITQIQRCLTPLPTSAGGSCSNSVTTTYTFDSAGLPIQFKDAKGYITKYTFKDSYSDSPAVGDTDAFLTGITRPATYGGSVSHSSTFKYTWASGLLSSSTDENNRLTSYQFDSSYRLHEVVSPPDSNNGGVQAFKQIDYDDTAPTPSVTTTTLTCAQNCFGGVGQAVTTQTFDGMGHVTDSQSTDLDNSSQGQNFVHKTYDGQGNVRTVSNPYWTTTNGTTTYTYDAFGRMAIQQQQDGSRKQWCYDGVGSVGQTNCHSQFGGSTIGTYVDEADENGNDWQRTTDSFGRLIQVEEPNGTFTTPAMETDYTYDVLNDLTVVAQYGTSTSPQRTRSFGYDPLGRLLSATNPEAGPVSYTYDLNSNVSTKMDARGVVITYNYDELNREISRNYAQNGASTGEPSPCHQYDLPLSVASDAFPKNEVTAEWMAPAGTCPGLGQHVSAIPSSSPNAAYSSRAVLAHDVWGHVSSETQCPTGPSCTDTHTFTYSYDLAGGVTQFNNGITAPGPSGGPNLTFNVTLDATEKVRNVSLATPFGALPSVLLKSDTTMPQVMGSPAYDVWGHLVAQQSGFDAPAAAGLEILSKYDKRGRVQSETAGGLSAAIIPTGSFGVVAVNGIEQSTLIAATASISVSGTSDQGPITWYPCGNIGCPDPEMDQGTISVIINGISTSVAWGNGSTPSNIATSLSGAINGASSTLGVTAQATGATVQLTANNPNTAGSAISLNTSVSDTTPGGVFTSPSFGASPSGSTFIGGGGPVYDTGQITVAITNADSADSYGSTILATATPVTWDSGSSDKKVALALRNAINTAASTYLTASLDASGNSIILTGNGTDSSALNYGVKVTVTDTTASNNPWAPVSSLPPTSFEFASSSLDGGSTGKSSASYALVYSYAVPEGGYTANGNLQGYSDTVMGDWAFQYDTLNRLTSAVPAPNAPSSYINTTGCWSYDPFGNRTTAAFVTSTDCAGAGITSKFDTANRVTFVSQAAPISYSAPSGLIYDSAGNVYWDPNNNYAYDGEGRVCAVQQSSLNGGGRFQYIYDASGNRIARATFTGALPAKNAVCAAPGTASGYHITTQYLLNLAGEQVTELDGSGNWSHTNVWSGPHLSATYDTVNGGSLHFHLSDPLGTRRVQVDPSGRIEETCQSLPFGDQLNCQTTSLVTADDATEHHFTGKERDQESGNDYFGARYYASTMGRFLSPDPKVFSKQRMYDPQQWNMYSYVRNNPLVAVDPDGKELKLIIVNSSSYSDAAMQQVGNQIAGSLRRAGVLNVTVEVSHHPLWSKVESVFSRHVHSIEYGPDGGSVKVKEAGGKDSAGVTVEREGLPPGHSYSGVDTNDTGANGEVMANYGKHEVGHDAGNADIAPTPNNSSDPMVSPSDGKGNKEYTPAEADKLKSTYNRPNEKEKKPNQ